jgi:hypothetical protein
VCVSQLRRAPAAAGDGAEIVTRGRGYELRLGDGGLDARRCERLIADGRLAPHRGTSGAQRGRYGVHCSFLACAAPFATEAGVSAGWSRALAWDEMRAPLGS